jgi:hypothetical protein
MRRGAAIAGENEAAEIRTGIKPRVYYPVSAVGSGARGILAKAEKN